MNETPDLPAEDLARCEVQVRTMQPDGTYRVEWAPMSDLIALVFAEFSRAIDQQILVPQEGLKHP
jgi:predicted transcriptional regulator